MEGFLSKWVNYVYGWKKRYFVLRGKVLEYRKVQEGSSKALISVGSAQIIPNAGSPNKFKVYAGSKTLHLKAFSTEEARRWVCALLSAQTGLSLSPLSSSLELPRAAALDLSRMAEELSSLQEQVIYVTEELSTNAQSQVMLRLATEFREVTSQVTKLVLSYKEAACGSATLQPFSEQSGSSSSSSVDFQDAVDEVEEEMFQDVVEFKTARTVNLRSSLPVQRNPSQKINIWKVIKDSIGRDLSRIAVPVYFNEPISFIQRFSEELTYSELLRTASSLTQPELRMAYVAAFTVSSYATTVNRTMKPFNPILGETFQLERDGFRLVSEQVSHHPPVTALHCEAPTFEFGGSLEPKTKFKGSYMLVHCNGTLFVRFPQWGEEYSWTKPNTTVHNIIMGQIYIDNHGSYTVNCPASGARAEITFKKAGWFEKSKQEVGATIYDAAGTPRYNLEGKWSEAMELIDIGTGDTQQIWRHAPQPEGCEFSYYFTDFAMQLNLPPDQIDFLPQTDSRFRPDQRALENGDIETAASEKYRLEEKQRDAKRSLDEVRLEYRPRWFSLVDSVWKYHGGYWEEKDRREFTNVPDIF
jgi:hypothetical protein